MAQETCQARLNCLRSRCFHDGAKCGAVNSASCPGVAREEMMKTKFGAFGVGVPMLLTMAALPTPRRRRKCTGLTVLNVITNYQGRRVAAAAGRLLLAPG